VISTGRIHSVRWPARSRCTSKRLGSAAHPLGVGSDRILWAGPLPPYRCPPAASLSETSGKRWIAIREGRHSRPNVWNVSAIVHGADSSGIGQAARNRESCKKEVNTGITWLGTAGGRAPARLGPGRHNRHHLHRARTSSTCNRHLAFVYSGGRFCVSARTVDDFAIPGRNHSPIWNRSQPRGLIRASRGVRAKRASTPSNS